MSCGCRYIHRPFLIDDLKFDLRLYVLLNGCDPLSVQTNTHAHPPPTHRQSLHHRIDICLRQIFLHEEGLVRFATEEYRGPTTRNIRQAFMHLTNYAINKANDGFEQNTKPADALDGHKRSLRPVLDRLKQQVHGMKTRRETRRHTQGHVLCVVWCGVVWCLVVLGL